MKVSVSLEGVQALRKRVGLFREALSDLRPAFARAAVDVLDDAQMQFTMQGDPPWAPKKHANGLPLLVRKGTLKQSLQASNTEAVEDIPGGIRVGTNLEYAAAQQFGTDRAGRSHTVVIPARPYLWRDPDRLGQMIQRVFARHIAGEQQS